MDADGEDEITHETTSDIPSFLLFSSDPVDENNAPAKHPPTTDHQAYHEQDDTFAADFFRCGADWSCLLPQDQDSSISTTLCNSERNLKQTNLFQMWGLKRPHLQNVPSRTPLIVKKMKIGREGSSHLRNATTDTANRPRLCPFYKKIPGPSAFL
jgi:DNA cross-link repair 1A protein